MLKIAKIANFKIERILERDFIPTNPFYYKVVIIQDFIIDLFLTNPTTHPNEQANPNLPNF